MQEKEGIESSFIEEWGTWDAIGDCDLAFYGCTLKQEILSLIPEEKRSKCPSCVVDLFLSKSRVVIYSSGYEEKITSFKFKCVIDN